MRRAYSVDDFVVRSGEGHDEWIGRRRNAFGIEIGISLRDLDIRGFGWIRPRRQIDIVVKELPDVCQHVRRLTGASHFVSSGWQRQSPADRSRIRTIDALHDEIDASTTLIAYRERRSIAVAVGDRNLTPHVGMADGPNATFDRCMAIVDLPPGGIVDVVAFSIEAVVRLNGDRP